MSWKALAQGVETEIGLLSFHELISTEMKQNLNSNAIGVGAGSK
jgi:hypothetical protein